MGELLGFTLRDQSKLVSEILPGHSLNFMGEVVEAPTCPLCGVELDGWSMTKQIFVNDVPTRVHVDCGDKQK